MTKKPSYRFAGYTESWEEKKLGEVAELLNGRAYKQEELLEDGEYRVLRVGNFNTNDRWYYSDLQLEDSKYANYGDLLYLWATNFGPELWKEEKVIYHYHIWKISGYSNILDKYYFYTFLEKDKDRIKQNTNGSTMVHITKGMMEERVLTFPSLPEQTAIGSFFQDIDQLIGLQQRKLEVLKEQKKTYLKLLFPAKGQTKPALRFAGFEDDWKEVKLGDFVEISKGIQRNKEFLSPNADSKNCYPVYNGGKQESGYTDEFNREGNIMISEGGASAGFVNYFDGKYWSGGHNFTIDELENDIYYVLALLESQQQELYSLQVGSGLPNIQLNSLKKVIITFPAFLEQQAIGAFFQDLDKVITKQEEKVNQLKESKQTLLRKMFI